MHARTQRLRYDATGTFNRHHYRKVDCLYNRWKRSHNLRPLQTSSAGAVKNTRSRHPSGNAFETQATLKKQRIKFQRGEDRDIIVNDLAATLLAHRAKNKASLVRRINVDLDYVPTDFRRPSIVEQLYLNRSRARKDEKYFYSASEGRKVPKIDCPRGNPHLKVREKTQTQVTARASKKGTESTTIRPLVPEHEGKDIAPCLLWKRRLLRRKEESPWLALVENTEGDGLTRYDSKLHFPTTY